MKLQYLGDSKDSFKWDYHDYLANFLKFSSLKIVFMMTPPDETGEGRTLPSLFRARKGVIKFCNELRCHRDPQTVKLLPGNTGSNYSVVLHEPIDLRKDNRTSYFSGLSSDSRQLVFIDPDNGFEPEKSFSEKHIRYAEIKDILSQLSQESVISIFQHFRRITFARDFARIKERLGNCNATAVYWDWVMFVAVSKSKEAISMVIDANRNYAERRPFLEVIS